MKRREPYDWEADIDLAFEMLYQSIDDFGRNMERRLAFYSKTVVARVRAIERQRAASHREYLRRFPQDRAMLRAMARRPCVDA